MAFKGVGEEKESYLPIFPTDYIYHALMTRAIRSSHM